MAEQTGVRALRLAEAFGQIGGWNFDLMRSRLEQ